MHELCKVNEVKLFYKEAFIFKDIFFRLTFACWGREIWFYISQLLTALKTL